MLSDDNDSGSEGTIKTNNIKESIVKWVFELNVRQHEVLPRRFSLLAYESKMLQELGYGKRLALLESVFVKYRLNGYAD
ncbi:MAG: hypothetical protein ACTS73_02290 [Arsenophonus sp. NEOnobi-MAG3]